MTALRLVGAFIARRPFSWLFHAVNLAIAVAALGVVLLGGQAANQRLERDLAGIDLVVGASGSPLQLVAAAVLFSDVPPRNLSLASVDDIVRHPLVELAVPVGLGDNVGGYPVIGTTGDFLKLHNVRINRGRVWRAPFEAVIGSAVARDLGLGVGDHFVTEHGLGPGGDIHTDHPYVITGVLAPSGGTPDRLILTSLESVWDTHDHGHEHGEGDSHDHGHSGDDHHHDKIAVPGADSHPKATVQPGDHSQQGQITALLVRGASPMATVTLPRIVGSDPALQVAFPAREALRLREMFGAGASLLSATGLGLIALSGLGFAVALGGAIAARRPDFALLRALGATGGRVATLVLIEGAMLGLVAGLMGWALARGAVTLALAALELGFAPAPPALGVLDAVLLLSPLVVGILCAIGPGMMAARVDPVKELRGR